MARRKNDSLDACPFPPDGNPPSKTLTTNMLEAVDSFFEGWRNTAILLTMMSIVLAYSLIVTPLTLIALSSVPDTWSQEVSREVPAPQDNYTWLYDGAYDVEQLDNIILEGNEVMEIINQTFHLDGYILLRDSSKLVLRNSQLAVNPTRVMVNGNQYSDYAHILLMNSSTIELYDSVLIPQEGHLMLGVIDEGQVVLNSSYLVDGLLWFDDSTKLDAEHSYMERLNIYGSLKGSAFNSSIKSIRYENRWRPGVIDPSEHGDGSLLMEKCVVGSISLHFIGGSMTIDEAFTGYHETWNPYVDWGFDGYVFNVSLIDSEVRSIAYFYVLDGNCTVSGVNNRFSVFGINSSINIIDSNLGAVSSSSSSKLIMNNSVAYAVSFLENTLVDREVRDLNDNDASHAHISRSNIQVLGVSDEVFITFNQVKAEILHANSADAFVKGDVSYCQDVPYGSHGYEIGEFEPLKFTQEYRVNTLGDSFMVPNVDLVFIDESGETVWEGMTDENGEALFNITYCNHFPLYEPYTFVSNYDEEWTLTGSNGAETVEVKIRFRETGSPITLQFPKPGVIERMKFTPLSMATLGAILLVLAVKLLKRN